MTIKKSRATTSAVLAGLLFAGALSGCDAAVRAGSDIAEILDGGSGVAAGPVGGPAAAPAFEPAQAAAALSQLETIPVKGRAPKTGYAREEFGPAWADVDRNG
jgi:hypothetical protein